MEPPSPTLGDAAGVILDHSTPAVSAEQTKAAAAATVSPQPTPTSFEANGVPVFHPTMEQFQDFSAYITSIESLGQSVGLAKIVPPAEWKACLSDISKRLEDIEIRGAITQQFLGGGLPTGNLRQVNVESRRVLSVQKWFELCNDPKNATPLLDRKCHSDSLAGMKRKRESENVAIGDTSKLNTKPKQPIEFDICETSAGFTPDVVKELEKLYWKNIAYNSPMYGADMLGSLFDDNKENTWNLRTFDNLLNQLNVRLPGVNNPYLYFGMWKATFAWHVEDMDLFSINYIHFGAPKQWYVIPPSQRHKLERYSSGVFFDEAKRCPQFLRHKTCLISPSTLASQGIDVHKVVQYEGEFMITFPYGYHAGFNLGFNCAESVNFALKSWLAIGQRAEFCMCQPDSVKMDMKSLFGIEEVKKLIGIKKVKECYRYCVLCPSGSKEDLMPTDAVGKYAHKRCGEFIPETFFAYLEADPSVEVIAGVPDIPKDRWSLKCQFCKFPKQKYTVHGACIQCYKGKCTRTYHVSCAKEHGIFLSDDFKCYCPQHAKPFMAAQEKRRQAKQLETAQVATPVSAHATVDDHCDEKLSVD